VCGHECDIKKRMKVSSILRHIQQIAIEHSNFLGVTRELFKKTGTTFFVSQVFLEFNKEIHAEEELEISTEAFFPEKAIFHRYTEFKNKNSCKALSANSKWILIDTNKRAILRKGHEEINSCFPEGKSKVHEYKIFRSKNNNIFLNEEKAVYSYCDENGHINNAVYADIICNYLPEDILQEKFIKNIIISYNQEVLLNEKIEIFISEYLKSNYYLFGMKNNKKCFESNIIF